MATRYELTKDLETGNAIIDREHKELFNAVNQLLDACQQGKGRAAVNGATTFLLNYVDRHFAHEEQLQVRYKYPEYPRHKEFHDKYKAKLRDIAGAIGPNGPTVGDLANLNGHIGVLISHIRLMDKKLGKFLAAAK